MIDKIGLIDLLQAFDEIEEVKFMRDTVYDTKDF